MNISWFDFVGGIGVALIIGSYLLLQLNKLKSTTLAYSLANGLGALLIIISLLVDFNLSAFIIETFWVIISVVGLIRYFRMRQRIT